MSDQSPNLGLPFVQPSQAQKHVTVNEGLQLLDTITQLAVTSATVTAAPASASEGTRYVVPAGATLDWSGQDGKLAVWQGGAWIFLDPQVGWTAWVADAGHHLAWDGTQWSATGGGGSVLQEVDLLGVQTSADATNRLAVASDAVLLTHAGAGHQLKINKSAAGDTASLLFQTNWSGRAEMGTAGSDDFAVKVSPDGTTFHTGLSIDAASGTVSFPSGTSGLAGAGFGPGALLSTTYANARLGLVTNGGGHLPSGYNWPAAATRDTAQTSGFPAAFSFDGHYPGRLSAEEAIAVDPTSVYRLSVRFRQAAAPGDWSGFANGERHAQRVGLECLDTDGNVIELRHWVRHKSGGTDSLTTLAQPLSPGDTTIHLTDATGWNDTTSDADQLGVIVFGYRSSGGQAYADYSRLSQGGLFLPGGVNKTAHQIALSAGFPTALGNPDDGAGTWPAGTPIANTGAGADVAAALLDETVPAATDTWFEARFAIGGIDTSGTGFAQNFAPGTAFVRPFIEPNWSNRSGGFGSFPDTGAAHRVWFAGLSLIEDAHGALKPVTTGSDAGRKDVYLLDVDTGNGAVSSALAGLILSAL